ncbi:hypothetical protein [Actinokineospora sp. NBRC 105648]|uniref:hypothetical protein n=1 Tax=Actinokineospora sp. NBRC 105648 TaxID=3032206 RepID=UPI0024A4D239|nr:hypothetical protein [Actinokineospora sp. NBRC 105648]GLZ37160.1 hypothetical protein Acsp05_07850 [Actinokineospora sp. NBRC 105648]
MTPPARPTPDNTPIAPPGGDAHMLSRTPQTTAPADPSTPWPSFVPSLVDDLRDLIRYANEVLDSITEGTFDKGLEIDNLDSTAYGVIEACRWLQVHQKTPPTA